MVATMNRPARRNAQTLEMYIRLFDAWTEASRDDDVRCIILTGAEGNFSSGMDLRSLAGDPGADPTMDVTSRIRADPDVIFKGLLKHYRPTKPIIAAVEGVAVAGGTEILQGTDIRVAGESARFGVSEARWSLYPMGGSAVRLRRQIPYTVAADLLLTGRHISAAEAREIGLVGHVVPDGRALDKARELAGTICENGPLAVQAILRTLHETDGMAEDDALRYEHAYGQAIFSTEDAQEGPRAFAEQRAPVFHGR